MRCEKIDAVRLPVKNSQQISLLKEDGGDVQIYNLCRYLRCRMDY